MQFLIRSLACVIGVLALGALVSACSSDRYGAKSPAAPDERALGNGHHSAAGYRLTVGDRIRVTIFDLAAETSEYTLDETGTIAVPAIQPLVVKQNTTKEAAVAISNALAQAGLYRNARVSVDVVSFGPFYILGEVAKPGEFAFRPGMSLFAAVALAGGHTYRAERDRVYIRRAADTVETEYELSTDISILPGDVVRVPELRL